MGRIKGVWKGRLVTLGGYSMRSSKGGVFRVRADEPGKGERDIEIEMSPEDMRRFGESLIEAADRVEDLIKRQGIPK